MALPQAPIIVLSGLLKFPFASRLSDHLETLPFLPVCTAFLLQQTGWSLPCLAQLTSSANTGYLIHLAFAVLQKP